MTWLTKDEDNGTYLYAHDGIALDGTRTEPRLMIAIMGAPNTIHTDETTPGQLRHVAELLESYWVNYRAFLAKEAA